jgi:hypothetical protein
MSQRSTRFTRTLVAATLLGGLAAVGGGVPPFPVPAAFAALGAGGEFHPVPPARLLDTRAPGSQAAGVHSFGVPFDAQLLGVGPVGGGVAVLPSSGVLAVVANVTVVDPNQFGFLTAYPSGSALPTASNVNFAPGRTVPNLSLLRPGPNGAVTLYLGGSNGVGSAHVLIDVVGWFSTSSAGARGARLVSLAPGRILDTRDGTGRAGALGAGQSFRLPIRGVDAVNPSRPDYVPATGDVTAVILNLTATESNVPTHVSIQPDPVTSPPTTSALNLVPGLTKANLVIVPVGADGAVSLYNNAGSVHLIADVVGYFRSGVNDESRAGRIVPLASPFRVFDTRDAAFGSARLGSSQEETWNFRPFVESVKTDGIWVGEQDAVLLNLTATSLSYPYPTGNGTYMTMYPGGTGLPLSSNINLGVNEDVPNFVVARLSADDRLSVYNNSGFIHYLADVAAVVLQD